MRICPKCGKEWPDDENRCRASYGQPARKCDTATIEYIEPKPGPEPDSREDLRGQADQIHDILEKSKPLTYEQIGKNLYPPISPKRASRIIGQMIRDGVELKREGTPRKVSLG